MKRDWVWLGGAWLSLSLVVECVGCGSSNGNAGGASGDGGSDSTGSTGSGSDATSDAPGSQSDVQSSADAGAADGSGGSAEASADSPRADSPTDSRAADSADSGQDATSVPGQVQCGGPADGGATGYLDPPSSWTYVVTPGADAGAGTACATVASVNGGASTCVTCTLAPATDSEQCQVAMGGWTLSLDPATSIVYITETGGLSWTPRCGAANVACAGPANGGTTGYLDPPAAWTYAVMGGNACATVAGVNGGAQTCVSCALSPATDSEQCQVAMGGWTLSLDPATSIVYITETGGLSWTPRCN